LNSTIPFIKKRILPQAFPALRSFFPCVGCQRAIYILAKETFMMVDGKQDEAARLHFNSRAALYAGLLVGALFLCVSRGSIPWASFGWPTHVMGRPYPAGGGAEAFLVRGVLQFALSIGYTFAVAVVVYRFKAFTAAFVGAAVGLVLYGLNYLVFHFALHVSESSEPLAIATHVVFSLIAATAYKGFSIPNPEMRPEH
jgi:hypothetical protein